MGFIVHFKSQLVPMKTLYLTVELEDPVVFYLFLGKLENFSGHLYIILEASVEFVTYRMIWLQLAQLIVGPDYLQ